jgi:hypothetical protein
MSEYARRALYKKFRLPNSSFVALTKTVIKNSIPANSTAPKRSIAVDMMDNASALPTCPQQQHQKP